MSDNSYNPYNQQQPPQGQPGQPYGGPYHPRPQGNPHQHPGYGPPPQQFSGGPQQFQRPYDQQPQNQQPYGQQSCGAPVAAGPSAQSKTVGWLIAVIGAVVSVLGVLRGLGKRLSSMPSAVAGAAGGLVMVGLTIYRWSWIHDKAGAAKDDLKASGGLAGNIDFHFGSDWGLWLTLVAGLFLLLAGVGGLVKRQ